MFSDVLLAKTIALDHEIELINSELFLLEEPNPALKVNDVFTKFQQGLFSKNETNKVSFGFTDNTIWAVLPIKNLTNKVSPLVLKIDNAWLDNLDVFFYEQGLLANNVKLGDSVMFTSRERKTRMPSLLYSFKPGMTHVVLRFKSEDPMTIPVYLGNEKSVSNFDQKNDYFYGALYGGLIILLIYNLALYLYTRELRYCLYSLYLFSFTAFNFTYTGHGFWLLWPDSTFLQQWLMPLLMFFYLYSGVLFTIEYLQVEKHLPKLYENRYLIYGSLIVIACLIVVIGSQSFAVMAQLVILTTMLVWMLVIGYYSHKSGNNLAKFFVPAILMGALGATVSSMTTWGIFPYTQWAFRGIEIGMLLEMSLLSMSFGFNFKEATDARLNAEHYARIDPLTNLYNRRALKEIVYPVWYLGERQKTCMAIVLIDIDWFKRINDEFGHLVGDDVLRNVARALKVRLRQSDIILRWGGEEFLIFLPNTELEQARALAETIRSYFDVEMVNSFAKVTVSAGVANGIAGDITFDELLKLADDSLYQAKSNGRNQVVSMVDF